MREIKFRAWDIAFKRMEYNQHTILTALDSKPLFEDSPRYNFMQFIEIKDKNDKEIYEGDIIKCTERQTNEPFEGVVEFNENGYWIIRGRLPITKTKESVSFYTVEDVEIIGNIYENPKLIEVKE